MAQGERGLVVQCYMIFYSPIAHTLVPCRISREARHSQVIGDDHRPCFLILPLLLWLATSWFLMVYIQYDTLSTWPNHQSCAQQMAVSRSTISSFLWITPMLVLLPRLRQHIHLSIACSFLSNIAMLIFLRAQHAQPLAYSMDKF